MGKRGGLQHLFDTPATALFRSALTVPLAAGINSSLAGAGVVGRWFSELEHGAERLRSLRTRSESWPGPLGTVVHAGLKPLRFVEKLAQRLDRARSHVRTAFPDWTDEQVDRCAEYSYEHFFRLGVEIAYTPRLLNEDNWPLHVEIPGLGNAPPPRPGTIPISRAFELLLEGRPLVLVTGHCGNWELLGYTMALLGFPMYALYRPLDNKALDAWVRSTRERRGLMLLDKFGAMRRLPTVLTSGYPVAFVADQNAGDRGLFVPYFGRLASTYKSIGLLAMQFEAPVVVATARRLEGQAKGSRSPFRYVIELSDVIHPRDWKDHPDPLFYLTARYRRALETLVRWSPEQYLWMHRIWKSRPRHERLGREVPEALIKKLRTLPWLSEAEVQGIVERSNREAAESVAKSG